MILWSASEITEPYLQATESQEHQLTWLWPYKKSRGTARSNLGLPVAQTFPFTISPLSLSNFLHLLPLSLSCYLAESAFDFSTFFSDHSYLNGNYFSLPVVTSPQITCFTFWQHSVLIFSQIIYSVFSFWPSVLSDSFLPQISFSPLLSPNILHPPSPLLSSISCSVHNFTLALAYSDIVSFITYIHPIIHSVPLAPVTWGIYFIL